MGGVNLEQNYGYIKAMLGNSAINVMRNPGNINLIAVSKNHSVDMIIQLNDLGQKIFGESKAQELIDKIDKLHGRDLEFHFIGKLQTNKVKYVVGNCSLIHSVDKLSLLNEINKVAIKKSITQDILIQINIADEEQKAGISLDFLDELVDSVVNMESVKLRGFMLIPPVTDEPEESRIHFYNMKQIFDEYKIKHPYIDILSMGMSDDFCVAIEEGATHIRVGTALFGNRGY